MDPLKTLPGEAGPVPHADYSGKAPKASEGPVCARTGLAAAQGPDAGTADRPEVPPAQTNGVPGTHASIARPAEELTPALSMEEERVKQFVHAFGGADRGFLEWLCAQDPEKVPETYWLTKLVREYLYTNKLGRLYGEPMEAVAPTEDFWDWLAAIIARGETRADWLPSHVQEAFCENRFARFLAEKQDLTAPPYRLFHDVDDHVWYWMHTEGMRRSPELRQILPSLTDPKISSTFVGTSGDIALMEGFMAYRIFKKAFEDYVGPIASCAGILDSGCGWGRLIRFFLKDIDPGRLWGIDPWTEAVDICRRTNRWCRFAQIDYLPPTPFADGTFDLIYLFSVFSHLSEPAHQRWLTEFHRILRPGGLLIATTWHREFIPWCAKVRSDPHEPCEATWRDCIHQIFLDTEKSLADYDAGKFCFGEYDPVKCQSFFCEGINSYGDACIPRRYVEKHWADRFTLMEFIDDRTRCTQNVIIAKRK